MQEEILEELKKENKAPTKNNIREKLGLDIIDYITNLQEENEYSNYCNEELRKKITNLEYKIERLENELKGDNK